jgi:hypothetical protein
VTETIQPAASEGEPVYVPAAWTGRAGKPRIQAETAPDTIRTLRTELDAGVLPGTYVTAGELVHVEEVSGTPGTVAADADVPLPVASRPLTPASLRLLLAQHTHVYQVRSRKSADGRGSENYEIEVSPGPDVLSSVLSARSWPGVPTLAGIIGAPVLRPDGTLLQTPGYDPTTGLYLASKVDLPAVPEKPTDQQIDAAKAFLLNRFLRDFPWASDADRANYIALLATPILRHFTRSLTPFGMIDATMPASGKSILTGGPGMLYGQKVMAWPYEDPELRKQITSVMADQVGVIVWDNLAEGTVIDSATLALLVTTNVWSDRVLGSSKSFSAVNDRLWLVTGNNLQLGGDMASRTVRVHLDPDMPRPELRDQSSFGIPHLDQWITVPRNQMTVLWHLLVLILDWTSNGAHRNPNLTMRQFTPWAQALGGFLAWHGIKGFLANAGDVRAVDEDETRWGAFLATWHDRHGSKPKTSAELRQDAEPEHFAGISTDRWEGQFITSPSGRLPNAVGLGRMLTGQTGRWRGTYVIRNGKNDRGDRSVFWVETTTTPNGGS